MKFDKKDRNFKLLPDYKNSFVYLLIKDDEVVYVGQTTKGLKRPFSHNDKDFNSIRIMYCEVDDLDYLEDKYIIKYKPIYNKNVNYKYNYSLNMIKGLIRKNTNLKKFNFFDLKKIIKILNIKVLDAFEVPTISFYDYEKIYKYIKENKYGK